MNYKIFTIIVSFNGSKWIHKCLESLDSSSLLSEVILVDNCSKDDTLSIIKKHFPSVIILGQSKNLGFGKANNIGISYALKNGADAVFLLNQDAYIEKDTLNKLIAHSKKHPAYGILSPIQCNWAGTNLEYYFSRFIMENLDFYSDYVLNHDIQTIYKVSFINAASWLIPRNVLEQVGGFDPIFEHYGEDNNYCQRLAYHGFKVGVVPSTYIYHDSKVRKEPDNYLFSEMYYRNVIKELQVQFADINEPFTKKQEKEIKKHVLKLILLNLIRLKLNKVQGYLKQFKVFGEALISIKQSRQLNIQKRSTLFRSIEPMLISIIIPTRNRFEYINMLIGDILDQDVSNYEIIVVDQSDDPKPIANCQHIITKTTGPCISRNIGAKTAKGEILVFLDDDARVNSNFIKEITSPIINGNFEVVAGAICDPMGNIPSDLPVLKLRSDNFIKVITSNPNGIESRITWAFPAGCSAIVKSVFNKVGGFNENFDPTGAGEDREMAVKLYKYGVAIWYNPRAKLLHEAANEGGSRTLGSRSFMLDLHTFLICNEYFSSELTCVLKNTILKKYRHSFFKSLRDLKLVNTKFKLWRNMKKAMKNYGN